MLAFSPSSIKVRRAEPDEVALTAYLRHAALWCLDMPERSPATIAAFLDRIPDVDAALIHEGRYFVVDDGREILGGAGWSPLGADMRAWLFGEQDRSNRADAGSDAVLLRGFFLHDRSSRKLAIRLLANVEAQAAGAGFGAAEIVAPSVLEQSLLAVGFRTQRRLDFGVGQETVPLVHMRKAFPTALSVAA